VDVALDPNLGTRLVAVGCDPEGKDIAILPGLAHGGNKGGNLRVLPGEVLIPGLGVIVRMIFQEPV